MSVFFCSKCSTRFNKDLLKQVILKRKVVWHTEQLDKTTRKKLYLELIKLWTNWGFLLSHVVYGDIIFTSFLLWSRF